MALKRDQILEADDLRREEVEVPEWGGTVLIAAMNGTVRDAWEQSLIGPKGKVNIENVRARLVAYTAVDEHGNRVFTEEDIERLGGKSAAVLERLCKVAQRLNLLTEQELEDVQGN
jgi:hypothetical protein